MGACHKRVPSDLSICVNDSVTTDTQRPHLRGGGASTSTRILMVIDYMQSLGDHRQIDGGHC